MVLEQAVVWLGLYLGTLLQGLAAELIGTKWKKRKELVQGRRRACPGKAEITTTNKVIRRCRAGYSNTGGPPLPRKRTPTKK